MPRIDWFGFPGSLTSGEIFFIDLAKGGKLDVSMTKCRLQVAELCRFRITFYKVVKSRLATANWFATRR